RLSVAAVNGPSSVVVSGDGDALDELLEVCRAEDVRCKRIDVDYASHSAHVERIRDRLSEVLSGLAPRSSQVPLYSTVTGELLDTAGMDAGYWYTNLRRTVLLEEATQALLSTGHSVFVEVSPHPVLAVGLEETFEAAGSDAVALGTLRRGEDESRRFMISLAEAHVHGVDLDWQALFAGHTPVHVDLPTYAFQRRHYWPEALAAPVAGAADPVDAQFWEAVEGEDLDALVRTLGAAQNEGALRAVLPALASWRRDRRTGAAIDGWRYRIDWTPLTEAKSSRLSGRWLLVIPEVLRDDAAVCACDAALAEHGARVTTVVVLASDADRDTLAGHIRTLLDADDDEVAGVLSFLGADESPDPVHPAVPAAVTSTLALVQALDAVELQAPLWCVTRGAVQVSGSTDRTVSVAQAQVWGMGRVVGLERPGTWGGLIDLPADGVGARITDSLCGILSDADAAGEDQLAVRPAGVFGRRLVRAPLEGAGARTPWKAEGTVLITGGTGALGGHVARWLAGRGAERLVLTSRRGIAAPGAEELEAELTALGAKVSVVACDVADRSQVAELIGRLSQEGSPVRSVIHTAGVSDSVALADTEPAAFADVLSGKTAGAAHLDELLGGTVDVFVTFSSIAGIWGSARQAAYATANAALDALAQRRRARGWAATSVAWGQWADSGMAAGDTGQQLTRLGLAPMDPGLAVVALHQAIEYDEQPIVTVDVDWPRFATAFTTLRHSPLIAGLPEVRAALKSTEEAPDAEGTGTAEALTRTMRELSGPEQDHMLLELVQERAATVLRLDTPNAVRPDRAFRNLGFDSLTAVELRNRLAEATGLRLPAALVFDHPTPTALTAYLRSKLLPEAGRAGDETTGAYADLDEALVRSALATVPLDRLRAAGLLDTLMTLADEHDGAHASSAAGDDNDSIDEMDAESLIQMALGNGDS
ncbi:SDR family NAD(P)-dependent oxidoreductase, partial [Streptomyces sp. ALB3]|uniref:SDR family NAD(P)-dependent oxidoreductase n=1 Tax=Streptomyces sp. ALB3 TaxID=3374278 RepID=UPI0037B1235D